MIRIIVYSTTNTAAKMYRKKKKTPFQSNSGRDYGWDSGPWGAHLPTSLCIRWFVLFSKRKKYKILSLDQQL